MLSVSMIDWSACYLPRSAHQPASTQTSTGHMMTATRTNNNSHMTTTNHNNNIQSHTNHKSNNTGSRTATTRRRQQLHPHFPDLSSPLQPPLPLLPSLQQSTYDPPPLYNAAKDSFAFPHSLSLLLLLVVVLCSCVVLCCQVDVLALDGSTATNLYTLRACILEKN